ATEALLQGPQRRPGIPRAVQADGFGTLQGVAVARHVALPVLARTEQAPVESQGWQGGGRAAIGAGWAFATVLVDGLDQLLGLIGHRAGGQKQRQQRGAAANRYRKGHRQSPFAPLAAVS